MDIAIGTCSVKIVMLGRCPLRVTSTLCRRPYPGHAKGCPNYGMRLSCPPQAQLYTALVDTSRPVTALWARLNFHKYLQEMKLKHPTWSDRQLRNPLYWQGTVRSHLLHYWQSYRLGVPSTWFFTLIPEAHGVHVFKTMKTGGLVLEKKPTYYVYKVALVGPRCK